MKPGGILAYLVAFICLLNAPSCQAGKEDIDAIIEGDWLLTMAPNTAPIEKGAVAVHGGSIVASGSATDIHAKFTTDTVIPGKQRILLPGLVNGHTHAAMTLFRGIGNDLDLAQWLNSVIFPMENALVDATFVKTGTELACLEMLKGGTTSFVDMYYFPEAVAQAVTDCGARAVVVPTVIDQQSPDAIDRHASLAQATAFIRRWKSKHPRVIPAIGGHAIYTLQPATLRSIRDLSAELSVPIGIHLAESRTESAFAQEISRMTPVAYLASLGLMDQPVIAAHVVYATDDDIALLRDHLVGVIHNPTSNMKLASGIANVPAYVAAGARIGLGTDGPASNNDLNMWEEMRLAAFLHKVNTMDPTTLNAETILAMATREGALAAGLSAVGVLAQGYRADLIQVDVSRLSQRPMYEPYAHLVYAADESDVVTVMVEGELVVEDFVLLTIDEADLASRIDRQAARVRNWLEKSADQ